MGEPEPAGSDGGEAGGVSFSRVCGRERWGSQNQQALTGERQGVSFSRVCGRERWGSQNQQALMEERQGGQCQ